MSTMSPHARTDEGPWTDRGDVAVPGGRLHWAAVGDGPPVVLLPKLGGGLAEWRHVAPRLAMSHRVVVVEPPGHGGSQMDVEPPFAQPVEDSARLLLALCDELGIAQAVLGGCSLGGCLALAAASLEPRRASALVMVSCATGPPVPRSELERQAAEPDPNYDASGYPLPRDVASQAAVTGTELLSVIEENNATRAVAGRWIRPSERGVGAADFPTMLGSLAVPVLLLYGTRDPLAEQFEAPALAALADGRSRRVAGAGRFSHEEQPEATGALLAEFLAGGLPNLD